MSGERSRAEARYARAIERRFGERTGRTALLSPREWALVEGWRRRRLPLAIVLEAIDAAAARPRPPRTLVALGPAVERAWRAVLDGRRRGPGGAPEGERRPTDPLLAAWRRRGEIEGATSPLGELVADIVAGALRGEDPSALDRRVDAELVDRCADQTREAARRAVEAELRSFAGRLGRRELERALERSIVERLRRELGLPRLSR